MHTCESHKYLFHLFLRSTHPHLLLQKAGTSGSVYLLSSFIAYNDQHLRIRNSALLRVFHYFHFKSQCDRFVLFLSGNSHEAQNGKTKQCECHIAATDNTTLQLPLVRIFVITVSHGCSSSDILYVV